MSDLVDFSQNEFPKKQGLFRPKESDKKDEVLVKDNNQPKSTTF